MEQRSFQKTILQTVLISLEIPRQMGYANQYSEATVVPHERINLPIGNMRRIL